MKNENNIRNLKPVGESLQVFENKFLTSCLTLRRSLFAAIVKYNKLLKARTYLSKTFRSNYIRGWFAILPNNAASIKYQCRRDFSIALCFL